MNVRFGIIGVGGIGRRFAKAVNMTSQTEIFAAASRDFSRAKQFADEFHAEKAFGSYQELMDCPEVDIVYIALPHNLHFEAAKKCLEAGKAVLCEKPMTTNEADAVELARTAGNKNLLLVEAMWTRMLPAYRKAKQWYQEGRIGTLKMIRADFCGFADVPPEHRLLNPALAGGSMLDVGVYPIEFITGIMESEPVLIQSVIQPAVTGVDETALIQMQFADGVIASALSSLQMTTPGDAVLYGTKGRICLPLFYQATKCEYYDLKHQCIDTFEEPCEDGFVYEAAHIRDLFLAGKTESALIPMKDTILSGKIYDTVFRQYSEQKEI